MKDLWTVTRIELLLFRRGRVSWVIALAVVVWAFFLVVAFMRGNAPAAWVNLSMCSLLLTLILAFTTENQIHRDRERRLAGVIFSMPVSTAIYVCGKYLAALFILLGFAALYLLTTVVLDLLVPGANYPPLGPWPYMLSWCWLVVTPLVFAAALTLCSMTLTQGQRVVSNIIVLAIWLVPLLFGGGIPDMLNISGNFLNSTDPAQKLGFTFNGASAPSAALAQQVIHLIQTAVPEAHLTATFLLNRLLFLSLAVLLVIVTIQSLQWQRQGHIARRRKNRQVE